MNKKKKTASPYLTGAGGAFFETRVQASFVALMLSGGFAPYFPNWPINKIKLQGKYAGYDTDDLIVFMEKAGDQKCKLVGQIKHTIQITKGNSVFAEVIQAAWRDYNNEKIFTRGRDIFALITGPLTAVDINHVRPVLEFARTSEDADEFFEKVNLGRFSSPNKIKKLEAFQEQLKKSNNGTGVSKAVCFDFLRHFHLLGYDLDIKSGVNLSLLHSLIGQFSQESVSGVWGQILDEVQTFNHNAGTITKKNLNKEIISIFTPKKIKTIPKDLTKKPSLTKKDIPLSKPLKPKWKNNKTVQSLAIANLIGSWNESVEKDIDAIKPLLNKEYANWISDLKNILFLENSLISITNQHWTIKERKKIWTELSDRIFDSDLDSFLKCFVLVLSQKDPKFELPKENRYAASLYGKTLPYSEDLRNGLVETLALLGNFSDGFSNCSFNKVSNTVQNAILSLFENVDWQLWGSLERYLPGIAEADPDTFLGIVNKTIHQKKSPLTDLFSQESHGLTGSTYMTGLLWSLETLAWDSEYLVRSCVLIGELVSKFPDMNRGYNPIDSLKRILLPWLPRTRASVSKRLTVFETLEDEVPEVAWQLALKLLPNKTTSSSGTHEPKWRTTIPEKNGEGVSHKEYWEQSRFYSEHAIAMADKNLSKYIELVECFSNLPEDLLKENIDWVLSKGLFLDGPEKELLKLWDALNNLIARHKNYSTADWALPGQIIEKIELLSNNFKPKDPLVFNRRLFSGRDYDIYVPAEDLDDKEEQINAKREEVLKEIYNQNDLDKIIKFAQGVDSPFDVGYHFAAVSGNDADKKLIPQYLINKNKCLQEFLRAYTYRKRYMNGWEWIDAFTIDQWSKEEISHLLAMLPFTKENWIRVDKYLKNSEKLYWLIARANPFDDLENVEGGVSKLIEYGRIPAALHCLHVLVVKKRIKSNSLIAKSLLRVNSSDKELKKLNQHELRSLIKYLQENPKSNPNELAQVEWAYLSLLSRYTGNSPKTLENNLAKDPDFFCELIRFVFRSEKEEKENVDKTLKNEAALNNAYKLLQYWKTPPGLLEDGSFSDDQFVQWMAKMKKSTIKSGHLTVALSRVGRVLYYCFEKPEGFQINITVAKELNKRDMSKLRHAYYLEAVNSRGAHFVDPTGKPEKDLAKKYRTQAEQVENEKFFRFASTLRDIAKNYVQQSDRTINRFGGQTHIE